MRGGGLNDVRKARVPVATSIEGPSRLTAVLICVLVLATLLSVSGCNRELPVDNSRTPVKKISGPVNYVALGDSTGVGAGATEGGYVVRLFRRISQIRPGSRLTNLCVSGATTTGVLREQAPSAASANPNLITLGIGINDIGHGVGVEEFSRNYDGILQRLTNENAGAVVIVTNIPDISSAPRIPRALRTEYHRRIVVSIRNLKR